MSSRKRVSLAIVCAALVTATSCGGPGPATRAGADRPGPRIPPRPADARKSSQPTGTGRNGAPGHPRGRTIAWSTSRRLVLHRSPSHSSSVSHAPATNFLDQRVRFLVARAARGNDGTLWLRILLPRRPDGARRWVRASRVDTTTTTRHIIVDLSAHKLVYERGSHVIHHFSVGIGQTRYPTPTGDFFVWAKLPRQSPDGPYGVYALGLNGFSHLFQEFPGPGGAHIAIHGTAAASDVGHDVSFGCVRVYNAQMAKLEAVPLGTPVTIRP